MGVSWGLGNLVIAGLDPAIHRFRKSRLEERWMPGSSLGMTSWAGIERYAASTSTNSESSSAVIRSFASSRIAAPSRALTRTPLTSTAPAAGTR